MFSIITVNLNNAKGLHKTIESVVKQTFTHYEYIIIDGNSTDGSVDIIKNYESKITYWVSEPDKGIYNAMNKGILKSKGEYIYFLNSGDYFLHNNVLNLVETKIKEYQPDILISGVLKVNEKSGEYLIEIPKKVDKISLFKKMISHQSLFVKRKIFDEIGVFDLSYVIKADYEWLLRALSKNTYSIHYFNSVLTFYPLRGASDALYNKYSTKEIPKIRQKYYSKKAETFLRRYIFRPKLNKIMEKLLSKESFRKFVLKKISK